MDPFIEENLEDYLAGRLAGAKLAEFKSRLGHDEDAASQVARIEETSALFDAIRSSPSDRPVLAPGFSASVLALIEREKETPFWMVFLQPFMVRRLAFVALMWLLALGSVTLATDNRPARSTALADMILRDQPPSEHYYVRLGHDLERNRASMLSVLMAQGD